MTRSSRHRSGFSCGGFTYIWVLLLVAFMGLSLVLTSEIYATSMQRDKEKELLFIGRQFRIAIKRYYDVKTSASVTSASASIGHEYPLKLEDLLKDNRHPGTVRHLRQIYMDPITGKPEWGLVLVAGRIVGVHSLSDRTPIKQGNFEAEDMSFTGKDKYSECKFTYPSDILLDQQTVHPATTDDQNSIQQTGGE